MVIIKLLSGIEVILKKARWIKFANLMNGRPALRGWMREFANVDE